MNVIGAGVVIAAAAGTVLLGGLVIVVARAYWRTRGERLVTCPETQAPAGVRVDTWRAVLGVRRGKQRLQLEACTRWPERAGCGQECLVEIENAGDGCLVRSLLVQWYAGKSCVLCGRQLSPIDWHAHKPALMSAERVTREWAEIQAVDLPEVLRTHLPICWDCHIIERLCREHPERVVLRQ
jgi:hypothetical protein